MSEKKKAVQTILVVEPDVELAKIIGPFFSLNGYRVIHTASTREAIKKLSLQKFGVLMMDPATDQHGEDVLRAAMTKGAYNAKTPVVLVSAAKDTNLAQNSLTNVIAVMEKPYTLEQLAGCLSAVENFQK
jgi:DNA-binding NtrC family response regulator